VLFEFKSVSEKIVLILAGGVIGLMSSLATSILNFYLQGIRQKREWEHQERIRRDQQALKDADVIRNIVARDQLLSITGKPLLEQLIPDRSKGCLAAGTKIRMADNSMKNVGDVVPGDNVMTRNGSENILRAVTVKRNGSSMAKRFVFINDILSTSESQYLLTDTGHVRAIDLRIGSRLIRMDGRLEEIVKIQLFNDPIEVFAVVLEESGVFIAESYCVADYTTKLALTAEEEAAYGH